MIVELVSSPHPSIEVFNTKGLCVSFQSNPPDSVSMDHIRLYHIYRVKKPKYFWIWLIPFEYFNLHWEVIFPPIVITALNFGSSNDTVLWTSVRSCHPSEEVFCICPGFIHIINRKIKSVYRKISAHWVIISIFGIGFIWKKLSLV